MPQYVEPAAIGHVNVEQDQIPLLFAQLIQSLIAAGGFTHSIDARIGFQELFEARSNHCVIVRD